VGGNEIAIRPEAVAPKEFPKLGEFFPNDPGTAALHETHDFRGRISGLSGQEDMDMIGLD